MAYNAYIEEERGRCAELERENATLRRRVEAGLTFCTEAECFWPTKHAHGPDGAVYARVDGLPLAPTTAPDADTTIEAAWQAWEKNPTDPDHPYPREAAFCAGWDAALAAPTAPDETRESDEQ